MAEEEFIMGAFKILSPDVIINKILFKMNVIDIVRLCSSSPEFQVFCNQRSDRIWRMLLRRDYPEHGIRGNTKQHYMKIFSGNGSAYVVTYNHNIDVANHNGLRYLLMEDELKYGGEIDVRNPMEFQGKSTEQVNILGNPLETSIKLWVVFQWFPDNEENNAFTSLDDSLNYTTDVIFHMMVDIMYKINGIPPLFDINDLKEEDVQKEAAKYPEIPIQPFTKQNIYNYMKDNLVFIDSFDSYQDTIWWQLKEITFNPPDYSDPSTTTITLDEAFGVFLR